MIRPTRRRFLQTTAAASTAFGLFTIAGTKASGRVLGANDVIRVGVCGINGRGGTHIGAFSGKEGSQVTYLIDPDSRLHESRAKTVRERGGNTPKTVQDVREALEDSNLDAISIATPNHWHSLLSIWACMADKDVYVEKPLSHNIHEGRILVDIARQRGRIVQHGTQSRSSGGNARDLAAIAAGKHGRLLVSRGLCYKRRGSIGEKSPGEPPQGLNFDLWLGPAQQQPYHGNLVHYNWHWFWDFGNGDIGNQGVHQMDIARWKIPGATWPKSVISIGGRFGYEDQGETPNTQIAVFDYGTALLVFEVRGLETKGFRGNGPTVGNTVHFDSEAKPEPVEVTGLEGVKNPAAERGPGDIFQNFLACVRSRDASQLDAHVAEGHISSGLCHLANISYRLGTEAPYSGAAKAFGDDKEAAETLERTREHLSEAGVPIDGLTYRVGRKLNFDAATERFVGDEEANRLITREYRAPYTVPAKV